MIFLGVDVGSSGCKCVAFSADGKQLYNSYREYNSAAGQADMDADEMYGAVASVIQGCAAHIPSTEVGAISITSFGESFVPIDKNGKALSRIIMYTDKRGQEETQQCIDKIGSDRIMDITCNKPDSMYSLPKIGWSMANLPEVRDHVWKFLLIGDYICYKLSGKTVINYSLACRALGLDVENRCWSEEMLATVGIDSSYLSTPVPCGSIAGEILPELATELGLPMTTKIVISAHDQVSAAIGAGVLEEGQAVDGTGSVECITPIFRGLIRNHDFTRKNYVCFPVTTDGLYGTYAFNFSGGVLLKWFRDTFAASLKPEAKRLGKSVYAMLDDTCAAEPSDIIVVPHFMGAGGTPDLIADATGTISGLSMKSGLPDIYRAVLEGLSFEMAYNLEQIGEYGIKVDSLRATGGGARSKIWLQIKADVLGLPIVPIQSEEAGAAGCAMLAAVALGNYATLKEAAEKFVALGEPILPNATMHEFYKEKYKKYVLVRNTMLNL